MSTTRAQRIGIWVIAAALTIGTIGSFLIIVLSTQNQKSDKTRYDELVAAYQKQVDDQQAGLSDKYYDELNGYSSRVGSFDAAAVTELKKEDLKVGTGKDITAETSFTAYYIGWNPSGKIFDSSIKDGKLVAPFTASPGSVIEGWTKGAEGMKVGGIRELTIPAAQAYGEQGGGADIPPNTPLKFVLMTIPEFEPIQPSAELLRLYQTYGTSAR